MSQLAKLTPSSGPGSGTVTSISAGTSITLTPNPITTTGTVALTTTNLTTVDGTVYWDGTLLNTTATGVAGQVLTSNGVGVAPSYQNAASSGITTINGDSGSITGATVTIRTNWGAQGGTLRFVNSGTVSTLTESDANRTTAFGNNSIGNASSAAGGTDNSAFGDTAGQGLNSLTARNTAIGSGALSISNGATTVNNTCVGYEAFGVNSANGGNNTIIGQNALNGVSSSSWNVCIGSNAGSGPASASDIGCNNNIFIQDQGVSGDTNTMRICTAATTTNAALTATYIGGINGVNVGSTAKVVTMGTGATADQLGTATITAGTGITVTPGANTITIAASGMGAFTWSVITANQTAAVNNGYFCNKAGTLALALPATSAVGDTIQVSNINTATGTQFTQAAGQQIFIGNTSTTLGATGTLTSSAVGDALTIVCSAANTIWRVTSMVGNWTPA